VTPTAAERQPAAWVAGLFLIAVLLQRFAVPGLPTVALLIPASIVWVAAAWARGVIVLDQARLIGWLSFASFTGMLVFLQAHVVENAQISVRGWAILLVIWAIFVFRLQERSIAAYMAMLRHITTICTVLATASIAMIAIQFAGVQFADWFAEIVPKALQLEGFNYTYPIQFGSAIFKSNAFIGLEPSMVSGQLGVGILAALLTRAHVWKLLVLAIGMIATIAGSGMIIVLIGVLVMVAMRGSRRMVWGYLVAFGIIAVTASFTTFGKLISGRVGEFQSDRSSTSLRVFEPYRVLFPRWTEDVSGALLGYGPGSSQRIAEYATLPNMLVTTPAKIFFEYGLIGGIVLAGFVLYCYWGGPSRALAASLLISTLVLQAGLASLIITLPALVTVTLWSPRTSTPIESMLNKIRLRRNAAHSQVDLKQLTTAISKVG
jgi:hypothetical protein